MDPAADHPGEVDAEEREPRVGDGIDQPADEVVLVRRQLEVFAPERHDPRFGLQPARGGDAVGIQAGASHQRVHP